MALMHVVVKQAEIQTQTSAQSDTTLMFVMQGGKAVPSGHKATMKILSLCKDWSKQRTPAMTVHILHVCALPPLGAPLPVLSGTLALEHCAFVPCLL